MGTVSNKQAKKPFFFVQVTVFSNSRTHSAPKYLYYLLIIMNIILCFTICCLLVATEAHFSDSSTTTTTSRPSLEKRDANSQLAFLSFVMALLNAIVNVI